jgi:hypothetical protein
MPILIDESSKNRSLPKPTFHEPAAIPFSPNPAPSATCAPVLDEKCSPYKTGFSLIIVRRMSEWSVEFSNEQALRQLEESLWQGPMLDGSGIRLLTEREVDRIGGLKVEVCSDEHPPPHFRVSYQGETANYRISDGTELNGGLDRDSRNIRKWHAKNKALLVDEWNQSRPTDCPVGEYREKA